MKIAVKFLYAIFVTCLSSSFAAEDDGKLARDWLTQQVRQWVVEKTGVPSARVDIPPLDSRLRVTVCAAGAHFDFPFAGQSLVRVRCDSPNWQVFVQVGIKAVRNILVASRDVPAGQPLTDADLSVRQVGSGEGIEDRSAVLGRILKRPLTQGRTILATDLEDVIRVVRLKASLKAGSAIEARDFALEDVPRNSVPAGAAPGVPPARVARVSRDIPAGQILLGSDISEGRRAMVARMNLYAGQALEPGLVEAGFVFSREPNPRYYTEFAGLEHSELVRNIQAGEALQPGDIRPAILVRRGQMVVLTVGAAAGLQVTLRAEALQDGKFGESVQLKNLESGRLLGGIVTGKNAARGL